MTTETKAIGKYIRVSSSKAQQVMNLIRGKHVNEADNILAFSEKGAAKPIGRVLRSAIANAEKNQNLSRDDLMVVEVYADQGPTLKRFRPRAMGRASRIRKRTSHITIVLGQRMQED
jgi:large subunit ribosomal protein L22